MIKLGEHNRNSYLGIGGCKTRLSLEGDVCFHHLDCGDSILGIYIYRNSSNSSI